MNVADEIMLAGSIVLVGTWVEKNTISVPIVVGTMVAALGTSVIYDINAELGQVFAAIILVGAILRYLGPLLSGGIGKTLASKAPPSPPTNPTSPHA